MDDKKVVLNRRDLIKLGALASGSLLLTGLSGCASGFTNTRRGIAKNSSMIIPKRQLGNLEVSSIGLGCQPMVGSYGGTFDRTEMIKVIRRAYESGVTFFDTAEAYGPFTDEEILGEAVSPFRKNVVIATKFGFEIDPVTKKFNGTNSRPEYIRQVVERSLKRLRTDYIDLYYQHRVDPKVPIEDVVGVIKDLIAEGKIKHYGLSEPGINTIKRAHLEHPITAIQNEYSIWSREHENTVIPLCEEFGIGFVPWCPLGGGFLAGRAKADTLLDPASYLARMPRTHPDNIRQNLKLLDVINKWAIKKGATLAQISLAWLSAQKEFIVPIPGTTNPNHLDENLRSVNVRFTSEELKDFTAEFSKVEIKGDRVPPSVRAGVGIEAPLRKI